jgi:DNA-binding MarR family transcriptional regulator
MGSHATSGRRGDDPARILDSLRRIVRELRATGHLVERNLGISGAQLFVLRELAEEPGMCIRRLSERTLTDPSSVSVVVARLVKRGLIARRRDRADARRSALSLTSRGRALLRRAPKPFQTHLVRTLRSLSRARLRRLNADLAEVVRGLGLGDRTPPMFFDEEPRRRVRGRA